MKKVMLSILCLACSVGCQAPAGVASEPAIGDGFPADFKQRAFEHIVQLSELGPRSPGAKGEQQAFLLEGKVSATVPEQAKGFTIATPRSRVLDLGTSFDLAVAANGDTELQVLDGLVETSLPADDESKPAAN